MAFPLDPRKTTSGIIVDPQTLERVVPATRRSDGSARKELKVRPGFTPAEDVQKYRSSGTAAAARLKGYVPGATGSTSSEYAGRSAPDMGSSSEFPGLGAGKGLTKAQKKNLGRKNKRAEEREARNWDSASEDEEGAEQTSAKGEGSQVEAPAERPAQPARSPKSALSGIQATLQSLRIAESEAEAAAESRATTASAAPTLADSAESPAPSAKPAVRPGGGAFRDLPLKSKDVQPSPAASPATAPAAPAISATASPSPDTPLTGRQKAEARRLAASRERPEIKVRPGGGLAGLQALVRSTAEPAPRKK